MKYRSDFVTNSSSSSYIIAYQQTQNYDEEILKKYPTLAFFNDLVDIVMTASGDYANTSRGDKATTKDELDQYFIDNYVYVDQPLDDFLSEEKCYREKYNACLDAIQNGFVVFFKSVDYSDTTLSNLIDMLEKYNAGVKVIDSDKE